MDLDLSKLQPDPHGRNNHVYDAETDTVYHVDPETFQAVKSAAKSDAAATATKPAKPAKQDAAATQEPSVASQ